VTVARQGGEYVSPHLSKDEDIRVVAGDTITVRTPGGGGYGDPWQRDPGLVARDVARGYVTPDDARRDYGVVLTGDDPPALDRPATGELRRRGRP
jgi:N-methylhydantoinase B